MREKRAGFGMNIGTSSILLIFVTLALVSFAVLSLVSANADQRLSKKVADRTLLYYEACNNAESALMQIDATLHEIYNQVENSEEYFALVGTQKSYSEKISEIQSLEVKLSILYPEQPDGAYYHIDSWCILTTGDLELDDKLRVFP